MRLLSTRAAPFIVLTAIALGACSDRAKLTQPPQNPNRAVCVGCGGDGGGGGEDPPPPPPPPPPVITGATPPNFLDKDGISKTFNVSFYNGGYSYDGVTVTTSVVASGVEVATGTQPVSCGSSQGTLPSGACSMTATAAYPLNSPVPGFPAGGAVEFRVYLRNGGWLMSSRSYTTTVYDDRPATFPFGPGSGALFVGVGKTFTGTIHNPSTGLAWSNISVRPYISQQNGAVIHYSAAALINCGSGAGVLPIGDCNISGTNSASNTSLGTGMLASGPAVFGFQLLDPAGNTIGGSWVNVTLTALPTVSVTLSGAAFLGDPAGPETAVPVTNTLAIAYTGSATILNVSVRDTLIDKNGVKHFLSLQPLANCGSGNALANTANGTCTFTQSFTADNTLPPGLGTLKVQLEDAVNGTLATQTVPITIGVLPTLGFPSRASTHLAIGGAAVAYSLPVTNTGPDLPNHMTIKAILTEDNSDLGLGTATRTVDSKALNCGTNGVTLPQGNPACTFSSAMALTSAGGSGTLVGGGRQASIEYRLVDDVSGIVLASTSVNAVVD